MRISPQIAVLLICLGNLSCCIGTCFITLGHYIVLHPSLGEYEMPVLQVEYEILLFRMDYLLSQSETHLPFKLLLWCTNRFHFHLRAATWPCTRTRVISVQWNVPFHFTRKVFKAVPPAYSTENNCKNDIIMNGPPRSLFSCATTKSSAQKGSFSFMTAYEGSLGVLQIKVSLRRWRRGQWSLYIKRYGAPGKLPYMDHLIPTYFHKISRPLATFEARMIVPQRRDYPKDLNPVVSFCK